MRQRTVLPQLREQAIALRRSGKSRREIKELLAITSNETLNEALRGKPPQPWTWRPNAMDDLRQKARELRAQGLAYEQIATKLGVSKSSEDGPEEHWRELPRVPPHRGPQKRWPLPADRRLGLGCYGSRELPADISIAPNRRTRRSGAGTRLDL
jgi:hypothetical protein